MKLNVVMENFFIVLKPLPESEEFFIVKLTKIEVLNKIIRSRQQIVNKNDVMSKEKIPDKLVNLYNEIYQIFLRDFVISVQRKGKPLKSLSSLLEYSLMYQGICFEKEYLSCYENLGNYFLFYYTFIFFPLLYVALFQAHLYFSQHFI